MIVMATSDVVKRVTRLKFQLRDSAESKTILKTLQKLKDLDMTLDVLSKTGIGKTVNSLRKHKQAGELAKSLVTYWKKLVPKDSSSNIAEGENTQSSDVNAKTCDQNCQEDGSFIDKPYDGVSNCNANSQDGSNEVMMTTDDITDRETTLEGEEQEVLDEEHGKSGREKDEKRSDSVKSQKSNHSNKEFGNNHIVPGNKNDDSVYRIKSRENSKRKSDTGKIVAKRNSKHDTQRSKCSTLKVEAEEPSSKTWSRFISSASEDDGPSEMPNGSQDRHGKNGQPAEKDQVLLKNKHKSKNDENTNTKTKKPKIRHEDEINGNDLDVPSKALDVPSTALSVSFESVLSYELNPRKKKKKKHQHGSRNPQKKFKPVKKDESPKELCSKSVKSPKNRHGSKNPQKKFKPVKKSESPKELFSESVKSPTMSENDFTYKKDKEFEMDLLPLPALPELYDKPSTDFDYYERKPEKIPGEAEEATEDASNSIGQRMNKRMQVYSGAKSNFLPTMMSLFQQCVRTLQNNIDMLFETGGVPFEILEPVLERCTANQLLRIEECNPVYIGETDHLWEKHIQREFRDSKLQEYESWKEMYVRLSEERERKFTRLTKTIVSAHSTKPKGRQVKMAFIHTFAKPPRDVRLQQEIHRSKSESLKPQVTVHLKSSDRSPKDVIMNTTKAIMNSTKATIERSYDEQYKSGTSSSGTSNVQDPRKKTRVAPMMAKSLKAFKKHLGRR